MAENEGERTTRFVVVDVFRKLPKPIAVSNGSQKQSVAGEQAKKKKRAPKKPVTFTVDPAAATTILVENLEEKDDVRYKDAKGKWVARPYTDEQRNGFDRDSILYYFQCILKCPTNTKFTTERISPAKVVTRVDPKTAAAAKKDQQTVADEEELQRRIRPLKIVFTNEKDTQLVLAAYNRNLLKLS